MRGPAGCDERVVWCLRISQSGKNPEKAGASKGQTGDPKPLTGRVKSHLGESIVAVPNNSIPESSSGHTFWNSQP